MVNRRTKTTTARDITGEKGVTLVQKISLDMGFPFQRTGFDRGIDGYMEVTDSATGTATNCIILVQSKATARDFTSETETGFDFYCDEADLNYWIGGNAPVILVCSRPDTNEGYWVPVKDYFKDPAVRKRRKVHFDKLKDRFDANCRDALVQMAVPKDSGIYLASLPKRERLYSNLLTVDSFAEKLYVAATDYRNRHSMFEKFKQMNTSPLPGGVFILRGKSILSFHNLEENPWREICDTGSVEDFKTDEWAYSDDPVKQREFVELLNRSLIEKLKPRVRYDKNDDYYYFAATKDLQSEELPYESLRRGTSRWIFRAYPKKSDRTQIAYYRHSAFCGRFLRYGNRWYLEITPHYRFTYDGYRESRFHEDMLKRIKEFELNPAVLGQVVMWAEYLRAPTDLFTAPPFLTFGSLMTFNFNRGIDDKSWVQREEDAAANVVSSSLNDLPLFKFMSE